MEYQETVLLSLSATANNLNRYTAQRIIDIMTKGGCKNLKDTAMGKCLNNYLHNRDIATKRIHSTKEMPAELMQLVKEAS